MWAIIKFDKKQFELLKRDFNKRLGKNFIMYAPKLSVQKYKNNKFIKAEFNLLGDYLFCFHENFKSSEIIKKLQFAKGLKYFLNGFIQSQEEIKKMHLGVDTPHPICYYPFINLTKGTNRWPRSETKQFAKS